MKTPKQLDDVVTADSQPPLQARAEALLEELVTSVEWLTKMQEEIRSEGHAGWGNAIDYVLDTLRETQALLLVVKSRSERI